MHDHDGRRHPLAWTYERGALRAAYIALGPDAEAYESAGTRTLMRERRGGCSSPEERDA